jgi:FkbM family methyltransferase
MSLEPGKKRPLLRRIGSKILRLFKPVATPVFNRLQARFQAAVEQSSIPHRLDVITGSQQSLAGSLASRLEMIEAGQHSLAANLASRLEVIDGRQQSLAVNLATRLDLIEGSQQSLAVNLGSRLDLIQGAQQSLAANLAGVSAALIDKAERVELTLQRLQTGADAIRLDLAEFSASAAAEARHQREALAAEAGHQREALAAAAAEAAHQREAIAAAAASASAAAAAAKDQMLPLLGVLIQRSDALLQQSGALMLRSDGLIQRSDAEAGYRQAAAADSQHMLARLDLLVQRSALTLGNDALVHTPAGFLLVPTEDRTLLRAVWESGGSLEPGTVRVLTALLREGDHSIDVGSHIGLTVLPAARKVGASGRVLAFEPMARVAGLLKQSIALNFVADRVTLHQCAAGDVEGKARIHVSPILGESSLLDLPGSNTTEEIDIRTVDSLVTPGQAIRLAKIDAEGFEPQVWKGMRRVVDDNPALAVIVEFGPVHLARAGLEVDDWLRQFTALGFTPMEIDEVTGVVRPLRPIPALQRVTSLNLLMLRKPPAAYPELEFE